MTIKMEKWWRKKEWEFIVNRTYLPFSMSLMAFNNSKRSLDKIFSVPVEDYYGCYEDDHYLAKNSREIFAHEQIKAFIKDGPSFLWRMPKMCEQKGHKIIKLTKDLSLINFSKLNIQEIKNHLNSFSILLREFSGFIQYPLTLESFFEKKIDEVIRKCSDKENTESLMKDLVEPIKFNESQDEKLAFLKIAEKIRNRLKLNKISQFNVEKIINSGTLPYKDIRKDLNNHLSEFGWLQLRWLNGKLMTMEDLANRLMPLSRGLSEQISFFEEKLNEIKKKTEKFIKKNSVGEDDAEMIWIVKEYVFLRTFRSDIINRSFFHAIPLLREIAYRLKILYEDVLYMSPEEISACLDKGSVINDIKISERKKKWALFREGDEIFILQGKQAEEFANIQGFKKKLFKDQEEIKGQIAYPGKAKGTIKIVLTTNDLKKILKGDILVAVMTFPSYIAAMEKAAAFVTNEGGILCHASIIAREMKKPCIIGTKIATRVLHDGDLVEVDADKGIVKILKRK